MSTVDALQSKFSENLMQVFYFPFRLSCNQHLEYLVNYLSNKWLRGKVGHKIILYPDMTAFLKNSPAQDR